MVILITYINCMREGISQYKLYYSGYVFIGVVAPVLRHFVLHKYFLLFFSACLVAVCLVFSYLTDSIYVKCVSEANFTGSNSSTGIKPVTFLLKDIKL